MFIIKRSITKLILKLLRHVSVFLRHPQGALDFCQLKLQIIKMIKYNTSVRHTETNRYLPKMV